MNSVTHPSIQSLIHHRIFNRQLTSTIASPSCCLFLVSSMIPSSRNSTPLLLWPLMPSPPPPPPSFPPIFPTTTTGAAPVLLPFPAPISPQYTPPFPSLVAAAVVAAVGIPEWSPLKDKTRFAASSFTSSLMVTFLFVVVVVVVGVNVSDCGVTGACLLPPWPLLTSLSPARRWQQDKRLRLFPSSWAAVAAWRTPPFWAFFSTAAS